MFSSAGFTGKASESHAPWYPEATITHTESLVLADNRPIHLRNHSDIKKYWEGISYLLSAFPATLLRRDFRTRCRGIRLSVPKTCTGQVARFNARLGTSEESSLLPRTLPHLPAPTAVPFLLQSRPLLNPVGGLSRWVDFPQ